MFSYSKLINSKINLNNLDPSKPHPRKTVYKKNEHSVKSHTNTQTLVTIAINSLTVQEDKVK